MKKTTLSIILSTAALLGILLSACGAAAPTTVADDRAIYGEEGQSLGAPAVEPSVGFSGATDSAGGDFAANEAPVAALAAERLVIKNANLSIVVDAPELRLDEIVALAERLGGFVVSSSVYKTTTGSGAEVPSAYITIRVPSDSFQQALDQIREGAIDIPSDNQTGQDVTAEYTDLQSRLRNLQDAEKLLRQIMEEATDTEDVLNAFNQLNYITEQIEVLKGQIQYYEDSASLSAISVELIANEAVQPIKVGPWDISGKAKEAIEALVKALQGIAESLVWFFLYVVPVLLIIGVPLLLIGLGLRRWLFKPAASKRK